MRMLRNRITEAFLAIPHRLWTEGHAARLGPAGTALLLALAHYADGRDGVAWPSLTTLAEATGMSRRSVITHLRRLRRLGYVTVVEHRAGRPAVYEVRLPTLPTGTGAKSAPVQNLHRGGAKSAPGGAKSAPDKEPIRRTKEEEKHPPLHHGDVSNGGPGRSVEEMAERLLAERERRSTETEIARATDEAHREVARALLDHGGRELLADFVELTRRIPGASERAWRRWLRLQVLPHLRRLGPAAFARAVADAVPAASAPGVRYPAAVIVRRLEATAPTNGHSAGASARADVDVWAKIEEVLGPHEMGGGRDATSE